jgi:hypothetical protein
MSPMFVAFAPLLWLCGGGCIENTIGKAHTGETEDPVIEVTPTTLAFGSLDQGDSATQTFTITSKGEVALDVTGIDLVSPAFTIVSPDTTGTLAPGESMDVIVQYSPINPTDTAWAMVRSDDPDSPSTRVDMTGGALLPMLTLDPPALDFGGLERGGTATEPISIVNSGEATLRIDSVVATGDGYSASFDETLPLELGPGESRDVDVTFTPPGAGLYNGTLWVGSNIPAGVSSAPLEGQAGMPVAVCSVNPGEVDANAESATFDGTASYDPDGLAIVSYEWTLIDAPTGSGAIMSSTASDLAGLRPDLAGQYTASLVVTNEIGLESEPCLATLTATPAQDLWVEMYWTHPGDDMDLHLLAPGGTLRTGTDCYYGNCVGTGLDWGTHGDATDDPRLDLDDIPGTGPENINIAAPEAGVFTVYVNDYPGSSYNPGNDVTVRIYLGGVLAWEDTRTIAGENDDVPFAEIEWPAATVTPL